MIHYEYQIPKPPQEDLTLFFAFHPLSANHRQRFLNLFSFKLFLKEHSSFEHPLLTAAETAEGEELETLVKTLHIDEILYLLSLPGKREGAFLLLQELKKDPILLELFTCLESGFYDKDLFLHFIPTKDLKYINETLKIEAGKKCFFLKRFHEIFGFGPFPPDQVELPLQALQNPLLYKEALDQIIWSLPTKGKDLSKLAWLPTTLEGLKSVATEIQKVTSCSLKEFPILIFDQSDPNLFEKNEQYIQQLAKKWDATILHLSKEQILDLASKLNITPLIDTTGRGQFGYGGARNAVFFLSPLIHHALKRKMSDLHLLDRSTLREWFEQSTLEKNCSDKHLSFIAIGDDDMSMPPSYFFSAPLLAKAHEQEDFLIKIPFIGRQTTHYLPEVRSLKCVLDDPHLAYQTGWSEKEEIHPIAGSISPPRFTLNLPFGGEENFDFNHKVVFDGLTLPMVHFAYTRFPSSHAPSSALDEIDERLKTFLPHILQFSLLIPLTDTSSSGHPRILPWKDHPPAFSSQFKKLSQILSMKRELQIRFFNQLKKLLLTSPTPYSLISTLEFLQNQEIPENSNKKLKKIYQEMAEDAKLSLKFINLLMYKINRCSSDVDALIENNIPIPLEETKSLIERKIGLPLATFPLTDSLYLLLKSLGGGQFCDLIGGILSKPEESSPRQNGSLP